MHTDVPEMNALMEKVFKILNLKGHWTGLGEQLKWIHGPCDIEGIHSALLLNSAGLLIVAWKVMARRMENFMLLIRPGCGRVKLRIKGEAPDHLAEEKQG